MGQPDELKQRMRADWDWRARQDAPFFVSFGRQGQTREEFFDSARDVLHTLTEEFRRFPPDTDFRQLTALEIGCGPARLMIPLSRRFGAIWGLDVSGEMVALARKNLAGIENADVRQNSGGDLAGFADRSVDFCYSYAVFQHIPDKEIVWNYLREARRVLKVGGILKCQFNGLPDGKSENKRFAPVTGWSRRAGCLPPPKERHSGSQPDTWRGVSFCAEEIAAFAEEQNLQLLAMDRFDTQYLWVTARKKPANERPLSSPNQKAQIVRVTDTFTADAVVAQAGRFASATVWVVNLTDKADLNTLRVSVDGESTAPCFIGKHVWKNPTQVNVYLPPNVRSGVVPVRLEIDGRAVSNTATMRVIPPGPLVPRVVSLTDAVNLLSSASIESRAIKVQLEEVDLESEGEVRDAIRAEIDARKLEDLQVFCLDPLTRLYEVDLAVPDDMEAGPHQLALRLGRKQFPPLEIVLTH